MQLKSKVFCIGLTLFIISHSPCLAQESWRFKKTYESKSLTVFPFLLMASGDLDGNKVKEIVVADFGRFGDHINEVAQWRNEDWDHFNLFVLEWEKKELKLKFSKQWDMINPPKTQEEQNRYFLAYEARQMVSWEVGNKKTIIETIPPYLGLEWVNGSYVLHEQHGWKEQRVGSWALPSLNPSCYPKGPAGPSIFRECIIGIRDFSGKGDPKIVTIQKEEIIRGMQYKHTLRVRKFEPGFPIEWEVLLDSKYLFGSPLGMDGLNWRATGLLLISARLLSDRKSYSLFIFEPEPDKDGYRLKPIQRKGALSKDLPKGYLTLYDYPDVYLTTFDLPDVYLRSTKEKGLEEYWGYHEIDLSTPERIDFKLLLGKVTLKPDLTGFVKEVIDFPYHKQFLGVGYFDLKDIDDDGLDEVILIEETGKKKFFGEESVAYSDIKDYIRILKWDGKEYKTMWVSPPYTKRGTKFLVEDIKNTGKKQLIVFTRNGTIQIWERE